MGNFFNRVRNTIGIVPRTVGAGIRGIVDGVKAALNSVLDFGKGIGKTCSDIKQAVQDSFNNGKRFKRLWKIPVSLALLLPMLGEGTVETLWGTGANAVVNTVETVGNTLINEGHAINLIGSAEDPKTYVLKKTDFRDINPKNIIANALIDK